jgi:RND family efflux transporter MFP subunit
MRLTTVSAATLCFFGCLLLDTATSAEEDLLSDDYECTIEPRELIKLGSADEGLISEITVERGDVIHKGDVVAKLDSDVQALQVSLAELKANRDVEIRSGQARLLFRQADAQRAERLSQQNYVATKTVEEAQTERMLAELAVKAAELDQDTARLELNNARTLLERRTIRSPVDGVVTELTLHPGEFAHKQSPVMTIAEINPLNVEVYVPITKYGTIEVGMQGEVIPEDPIGGKYLAEVKIVDRVFDTASSTFGVRLALPNPNFTLPAGLKCRVRFLPKPVQQASP